MRYFIETYGCQMNDRDSEKMAGMLAMLGYKPCDSPEDADVVLINTCSVRAKPEHKVYSALGRLKELKKSKPQMVIGVTGCVAQQEGKRLLKRAPHLDIVIGTGSYHKLPDILSRAKIERERIFATDMPSAEDDSIFEYEHLHETEGKISAMV